MTKRKVVVSGGGKNLYEISESNGTFWVYKVNVGLILNDRKQIGKTTRMDDALSIIRSHSGREIDTIS